MFTLKNSTRGFTLIELLVVITIIGILATLGVSQFTAQLQKTRDSKRISDVEKIKWAIETYNLDNTKFPATTTFSWDLVSYLPVIPFDPKTVPTGIPQTCAKKPTGGGYTAATVATKCDYAYNVWADSNGILQNAFELSTAFENIGNIDSFAVSAKDKGDCNDRLEVGTQYSAGVWWPLDLKTMCGDNTSTPIYLNAVYSGTF